MSKVRTYLTSFFLLIVGILPLYSQVDDNPALAQKQVQDFLKNKQWDEAIKKLTELIEWETATPEFYYNRGYAYQQKGMDSLAQLDYNKVVELKPQFVDAIANSALLSLMHNEYTVAIEGYSKAIFLDSTRADFYTFRGNAYFKKGNYDNALLDYTSSISKNSKS